MSFDPSILLPADHLLYRPSSAFGWVIAIKTWHRVSHIETYFGRGWSMASREKTGVDFYPLRTDRLCRVLRPTEPVDMPKAMDWFYQKAKGQGYDYLGLLCFTLAVRQGSQTKMWCSEFSTRWDRAGGFQPFGIEEDADKVAPGTFMASPHFEIVWTDGDPV